MGRKPIGSKPMTSAERQRRYRQGINRLSALRLPPSASSLSSIGSNAMTRAERTDLGALIRRREKLLKTAAKQRALELIADFEKQISAVFSYDDDETWGKAYSAAEQAVNEAKVVVARRCHELGIPAEFAPDLSFGWYGRGQNASNQRRIELRRVAKTEIDALEARAKTEIERVSVEQQTALISDGLTSVAAQAFLEQMPTAENLMPMLDIDQINAVSSKD